VRFAGRLTEWNDDKGYGFVVPNGGGDRAFVHVKAFERAGRRPVVGDLLSYESERDAKGRANAVKVKFAGQRPVPAKASNGKGARLPRTQLALASFAGLGLAGWMGKMPIYMLAVFGAMSLVSFLMYWRDKRLAENGEWRTAENELHAADILGGWPGGLLAQGVFRHKSSKASFQGTFWCTVVVNCVVVYFLLQRVQ
jgi:uncharacterized membrane protein YsdA (DUF1294 family)/cold shock CspA family protein